MQNLIKRLELQILKTPSGELRNLLCDINTKLNEKPKFSVITQHYDKNGWRENKVVGVVTPEKLNDTLQDIKERFFNENHELFCDDYYAEIEAYEIMFDNKKNQADSICNFFASNFILDELSPLENLKKRTND
jgi:hypothetical protein